MLEYLHLKNVGPSPETEIELAPRLNLITGDNGLGKSFLLDVAWWALTRRWPHDLNPRLTSGYPARPTDPREPAVIGFRIKPKGRSVAYESTYAPRDEAWIGRAGRPWNPGLVIYAHADGGFSVWDPARNYWKTKGDVDTQERIPAYVFSANDVWDGLQVDLNGKRTIACNGLLRDWASWIRENSEPANLMARVVGHLAPAGEPLNPGPLMRLSVNDARDIPSIQTAYSQAVPILHASSGIRRIVGLAYMLIWSWNEHVLASKQLGENRTSQVTMLVDEIESHLHPRWQRSILNSLLHSADDLHILNAPGKIQLVAATHSPLILASAEPAFDPEQDAWFDLDFVQESSSVILQRRPFVRQGTADNWLTSQAFDLPSEGRSIEAEHAIFAAKNLLERRRNGESLSTSDIEKASADLRATLPDVDRFWIRWDAAFHMPEATQ